ncbi:hypothetical protein [Metabacillus niabensis]|uniref:hypothetical protein n=1 Tax=Metabacillus niabensis TaxID=324854 RepID=UPI001CFB367F|nr:hypothetical protein [Metabacillus niabensis]
MINVAIISGNPHIQKSLSLLVKTDPDLNIVKAQNIVLDKNAVFLVDTELEALEDCLKQFSEHVPIILYSHSKEFLDMSHLLNKYKVKFFNVYTKPECILQLIKEPFR